MKKTIWISSAIFISLLSILFLNQLFKALIALLILNAQSEITFSGIIPSVHIFFQSSGSLIKYAFVLISPLLLSIILIELSLWRLAKTLSENIRSGLLIFQVVNIGYIIFSVMLNIFDVILKSTFGSDWNLVLSSKGFSNNEKLIGMLLLLILLLSYINTTTRRIKKCIPSINKSTAKDKKSSK